MPADLPDEEVVVVKVLSGDELAVEEQPEVPRPRPPLVRVLELVADLLGDALGVPTVKGLNQGGSGGDATWQIFDTKLRPNLLL